MPDILQFLGSIIHGFPRDFQMRIINNMGDESPDVKQAVFGSSAPVEAKAPVGKPVLAAA